MERVLQIELAPGATSLVDDTRAIRITKSKSIFKRKLQEEKSSRTIKKSDVIIIDGCAIFWIIHWPAHGTVQNYIEAFVSYVVKQLSHGDVYLFFDQCNDYSIENPLEVQEQVSRLADITKLHLTFPSHYSKSLSLLHIKRCH